MQIPPTPGPSRQREGDEQSRHAGKQVAATRPRAAGAVCRQVEASAARTKERTWRREWWLLLALCAVGVLTRVFTTNSLAGEPTSDEFLYGVYTRDLARAWASGQSFDFGALAGEGRAVVMETAALAFVLPWDAITAGRAIQALFNALCVPATYVLARRVGLRWPAAVAAAVLLLAVPDLQESAWRFWTDSQATFLTLIYLAGLASFVRRPTLPWGATAVIALGLLFATKDSLAITVAPVLPLVLAARLLAWLPGWRWRAAAVAALAVVCAAGVLALVRAGRGDLAHAPLLGRAIAALPLVTPALGDVLPRLPDYVDQLAAVLFIGATSVAFLWAWALGTLWLLVRAVLAWRGGGLPLPGGEAITLPERQTVMTRLGWVVAAVVWVPIGAVPLRALGPLNPVVLWLALGAGVALAALATSRGVGRSRDLGWGLVVLGLAALALFGQRFVILASPKLGGGAAFTVRSFLPIVPLFAVVGGAGLSVAVSGLVDLVADVVRRRRLPTAGVPRPAYGPWLTVGAAAVLVLGWSPLLERASFQPLVGRVADRGADASKGEGLRVDVMADAESFLRATIRPTDVTITGAPRQLAWYGDLGVAGLANLIDLGSQPRTQEERRAYIQARVGPTGADYVVDFNVYWSTPNSDNAREWRQTYEWLASQPHLETVYLVRDPNGHPVFYVVRNDGYAFGQTYRDREQARAEQLSRSASR